MIHTLFRDALSLALSMMLSVVVLLLFFINDPTTPRADVDSPGSAIVTIVWPDDTDDDVDLWMTSPGDGKAVGYSNKSGEVWNLLRDDTGRTSDITGLNYENAFSRGLPPGKYVVNAHCYRCSGDIPVKAEVKVKDETGTLHTLALSELILRGNKDEKTVVAFEVLEGGAVDKTSINNVYVPIHQVKAK